MKTAMEIRARVDATAEGKGPRQRRYAPEVKAAAVAYARGQQAEGRGLASVADELGLSDQTLRTWLDQAEASAKTGAVLRPVVVKPSPAPEARPAEQCRPTLVTPDGFRVEGLSLEQLGTLLRDLR